MATDIDWIARLRTSPSQACPSEQELRAFVDYPESVSAESFSHIVGGCAECRAKLQKIALHPSADELGQYLSCPEDVPEEVVFHFLDCSLCRSLAREALNE